MLSLLDYENDFPGVAYHKQIKTWQSICPDPNLLFKNSVLSSSVSSRGNHVADLIAKDRKIYLGKGMSLQYKIPLHIVRGEGSCLIDSNGRSHNPNPNSNSNPNPKPNPKPNYNPNDNPDTNPNFNF